MLPSKKPKRAASKLLQAKTKAPTSGHQEVIRKILPLVVIGPLVIKAAEDYSTAKKILKENTPYFYIHPTQGASSISASSPLPRPRSTNVQLDLWLVTVDATFHEDQKLKGRLGHDC